MNPEVFNTLLGVAAAGYFIDCRSKLAGPPGGAGVDDCNAAGHARCVHGLELGHFGGLPNAHHCAARFPVFAGGRQVPCSG